MEQKIHISLDDRTRVQVGSGSSDYNELSNKPQINGVTLENNKTAQELNLATNTDLGRYFDLYFKSVDYVFAGINPELELLENPVQVVIGSEGMGDVNLDYPLDLVEGKNYHIKATIGKLDGSVEEYESDITAQRNENQPPLMLYVKYDDNRMFMVVDKAKLTPTGGTEADENASCLSVLDGTKVWSYVTFTSIVQKEKTSANLLKEPVVITKSNLSATLDYLLGLEVGKSYNITFKLLRVDGTETEKTITLSARNGTDVLETLDGAKVIYIEYEENAEFVFASYILDGAIFDIDSGFVLSPNQSGIFADFESITSITFESITAE